MNPQIKIFLLLCIFALLPQRTNAITIHDIAPLRSYAFDVFGVPPEPLSLVNNGSQEWLVVFQNLGFRTPTQLEVIVRGVPEFPPYPEGEDLDATGRSVALAFMEQFRKSLQISSYQRGLEPPGFDLPPDFLVFDINIPDTYSSAPLLLLSLSILLFPAWRNRRFNRA